MAGKRFDFNQKGCNSFFWEVWLPWKSNKEIILSVHD